MINLISSIGANVKYIGNNYMHIIWDICARDLVVLSSGNSKLKLFNHPLYTEIYCRIQCRKKQIVQIFFLHLYIN